MSGNDHHSAGVLCFLAGVLAGAGAALLLAPQSGKDTRRALRRLHEVDDPAQGLRERFVRRGEQIRARAAHLASTHVVDVEGERPSV